MPNNMLWKREGHYILYSRFYTSKIPLKRKKVPALQATREFFNFMPLNNDEDTKKWWLLLSKNP